MTLAHPWVLHFLWLLPLIALALIMQNRKKTKALEQFADPELLPRLTEKDLRGRRFVKGMLVLVSLGMALLGLAGPRWGSHLQEVSQKGVDIMILMDVSTSMLVEDVKPNRLERAKREILDFLRVVQGDRVGLVAFSGTAFIQCPLTLDYAALEMFLSALQPDLIPVPGTDLGAAIVTGMTSFDLKTETDKVILLITDGEDNEKRGLEAAREGAKKGLKIFVFGIGVPSGGPIPAGDGTSGFKKDKDGRLIFSKLDEEGLREIASLSGGMYVRSVAGDLDLDVVYFEGMKSKTEAQILRSGKIRVYEEHFTIFVLIAFLLLLLEGLIEEKGKQRKGANLRNHALLRSVPGVIMPYLFLHFIAATEILAAENGDELYRRGRFSEAEKVYARLGMDHPKDVRYRYNRGCAAYQNADFPGAEAAFSSVLKRTKDKEMYFKAAYNLGNTAYRKGDFGSAIAYFRESLLFNPSSEDAQHNLELSLRALEKQKENKTGKPEGKPGQNTGPEGKEQNKSEPSKDKTTRNDPSDQKNSSDQNQEGKPPRDENQGSEKSKAEQPGTGQRAEQEAPKDLSGRLKGPQEPQEKSVEGEEKTGTALSLMDKKKAEAMIDNLKEDRSRFLRFQLPEEKRYGGTSGKDW